MLLVLLPQTCVLVLTRLQFPLLSDEEMFHLPSILFFRDSLEAWNLGPHLFRSYPAANGPLPYVLFTIWGSIAGFDSGALRWLSVLFGAGALLVFYRILTKIGAPEATGYTILLATWPYFLLYSCTLLVHSVSIFLGCCAVLMVIKGLEAPKRRRLFHLVGAICGVLAIFTRQTALVTTVALYCYVIFAMAREGNVGVVRIGVLSVVMFLVSGMGLFLAWGGLVPPAFQQGHRLDLSFEAILLLGVTVGVFLAPVLSQGIPRRIWASGAIIVVLTYGAKALVGRDALPISEARGVVPFAFEVLHSLVGLFPTVAIELVIATAGLAILLSVAISPRGCSPQYPQPADDAVAVHTTPVLRLVCLTAIASSLATERLYELYLIGAYPWLLALCAGSGPTRWRLLAWVIGQSALGIGYFWAKAYVGI